MKLFFRVRKAHMTLLETLIAISLLSIILVFVFSFFRELSQLSRLTEQAQKESFQMRYLESRLGFIFERVVNENKKDRIFYFYTQPIQQDFSRSTSLILTFNNEVRRDPTFSGDVLGRLYVDSNQRLCLATWPLHVAQPHQYLQEEVLIDHVVSLNYSFYAPPERVHPGKEMKEGHTIDPDKKTPQRNHWHEGEWALSYAQMPSIIKIVVEVAKNSEKLKEGEAKTRHLTFGFVLPSSKNPVYYPPT